MSIPRNAVKCGFSVLELTGYSALFIELQGADLILALHLWTGII